MFRQRLHNTFQMRIVPVPIGGLKLNRNKRARPSLAQETARKFPLFLADDVHRMPAKAVKIQRSDPHSFGKELNSGTGYFRRGPRFVTTGGAIRKVVPGIKV